MKDEKQLSLFRKSKREQSELAKKQRKYQSAIYEKLGKHIATKFQIPLTKKTTKKVRGKVTHPSHIIYKRDSHGKLKHDKKGKKIPEMTQFYTYSQFNQYFKITKQ